MPINISCRRCRPGLRSATSPSAQARGAKSSPASLFADIETYKATMECRSVDEVPIAEDRGPKSTADVPVNQLIAVLAVGLRTPRPLPPARLRAARSPPQPAAPAAAPSKAEAPMPHGCTAPIPGPRPHPSPRYRRARVRFAPCQAARQELHRVSPIAGSGLALPRLSRDFYAGAKSAGTSSPAAPLQPRHPPLPPSRRDVGQKHPRSLLGWQLRGVPHDSIAAPSAPGSAANPDQPAFRLTSTATSASFWPPARISTPLRTMTRTACRPPALVNDFFIKALADRACNAYRNANVAGRGVMLSTCSPKSASRSRPAA